MTIKDRQLESNIHLQCGKAVDMIIKSSLIRKSLDNVTCLLIAFKNFETTYDTLMKDRDRERERNKVDEKISISQSTKNTKAKTINYNSENLTKEDPEREKLREKQSLKINLEETKLNNGISNNDYREQKLDSKLFSKPIYDQKLEAPKKVGLSLNFNYSGKIESVNENGKKEDNSKLPSSGQINKDKIFSLNKNYPSTSKNMTNYPKEAEYTSFQQTKKESVISSNNINKLKTKYTTYK